MIRRKAFDPRNVPSLELWLDAAETSTVSLDVGVRAWADKSGTGRTATQVATNSQPLLLTNGIGGKPSLSFDGYNDTLAFPTINMTQWTVFLVCSRATGVANATALQVMRVPLGVEAAVVSVNSDYTNGPVLIGAGSTGSSAYKAGGNLSAGTARVLAATFDGSSYAAWDSGVSLSLSDGSVAAQASGNDSRLGASWSAGALRAFWKGTIAEVLVYSSALAAGPRAAVEARLRQKWGI